MSKSEITQAQAQEKARRITEKMTTMEIMRLALSLTEILSERMEKEKAES